MSEPATPPQHVSTWGPPAEPRHRKPRQASLWNVAAGYLGVLFIPSLILLPVALYLAYQETGSSNPQEVSDAAEQALTGSGALILAGLLLQWAILLAAVWAGGRKTEGGWKALVGWGIRWRVDLPIAAGFAAALVAAQFAASFILSLFDIDTSTLGNTSIITDARGAWLIVMVAGAVIGAPLVEELFFRGLFFNVARRKWGPAAAIVVSSIFFGLLHVQATLAATMYTVSATTLVGVCLAVLYYKTGRLGTAIAAHAAFNAAGVTLALLAAG